MIKILLCCFALFLSSGCTAPCKVQASPYKPYSLAIQRTAKEYIKMLERAYKDSQNARISNSTSDSVK